MVRRGLGFCGFRICRCGGFCRGLFRRGFCRALGGLLLLCGCFSHNFFLLNLGGFFFRRFILLRCGFLNFSCRFGRFRFSFALRCGNRFLIVYRIRSRFFLHGFAVHVVRGIFGRGVLRRLFFRYGFFGLFLFGRDRAADHDDQNQHDQYAARYINILGAFVPGVHKEIAYFLKKFFHAIRSFPFFSFL